jgi:hypothetical protein
VSERFADGDRWEPSGFFGADFLRERSAKPT